MQTKTVFILSLALGFTGLAGAFALRALGESAAERRRQDQGAALTRAVARVFHRHRRLPPDSWSPRRILEEGGGDPGPWLERWAWINTEGLGARLFRRDGAVELRVRITEALRREELSLITAAVELEDRASSPPRITELDARYETVRSD